MQVMEGSTDFDILSTIGKGGSGKVYKARSKVENKFLAIKHIELDHLTTEQVGLIRSEIHMLRSLTHEFIVSFYGMEETAAAFHIMMEFAECGSLRHFYQNKGKLTSHEAAFSLSQLAQGLGYLHAQGFAHRDLKCANCLVFSSGVVKLADFGASKRIENISVISGLKGTPQWMSPEVIRGTQGKSGWMLADIWSLGCTAAEMLTAQLPFAEFANPMTAMYRIASGETPRLDHSVVEDALAREFVAICCTVDPQQRPAATALLSLPWLAGALAIAPPTRLFAIDDNDSIIVSARGRPMTKVLEEEEEIVEEEDNVKSVSTSASISVHIPSLCNKTTLQPTEAIRTRLDDENDVINPALNASNDPQYDSDDFELVPEEQPINDNNILSTETTFNSPSKASSQQHCSPNTPDSPVVLSSADVSPVKFFKAEILSSSAQDVGTAEGKGMKVWSKLQVRGNNNRNDSGNSNANKNSVHDEFRSAALRAQSAGITHAQLTQYNKAMQPLKKLRRRVEVQQHQQARSRPQQSVAQYRHGVARQVSTAPANFSLMEEPFAMQTSPGKSTFLLPIKENNQVSQASSSKKAAGGNEAMRLTKLRRRVVFTTNNAQAPGKLVDNSKAVESSNAKIVSSTTRQQQSAQQQVPVHKNFAR